MRAMGKLGRLGIAGAAVLALATGGACSTMSRATTSDKKSVAFDVGPNMGAASGDLKVWSQGDQQHVQIHVKHLPPNTHDNGSFVVWLHPEGSEQPYNVGVLSVGKDRGAKFETTTPFRDFRISITEEADGGAQQPSGGPEVMQARIEAARRVY